MGYRGILTVDVTFHRVLSVPDDLEVGGIYFVRKEGNLADLFVVGSDGVRVDILSDLYVDARVDAKIAGLSVLKVVADVSGRDAIASPNEGEQVYVLDASGDSTVDSGAAKYIYDGSGWVKVYEEEGIDIDFSLMSVGWGQLTGKPASVVSMIDEAVDKRHGHGNKGLLDDFFLDTAGRLSFVGDGNVVSYWRDAAGELLEDDVLGVLQVRFREQEAFGSYDFKGGIYLITGAERGLWVVDSQGMKHRFLEEGDIDAGEAEMWEMTEIDGVDYSLYERGDEWAVRRSDGDEARIGENAGYLTADAAWAGREDLNFV